MTFAVITDTPHQYGNMASAMGAIFIKTAVGSEDNNWQDEYAPVPLENAMHVYSQVFWRGEILVLDDNGREIGGQGRKPSKWYVTVEHFDRIEDAVLRSREVT